MFLRSRGLYARGALLLGGVAVLGCGAVAGAVADAGVGAGPVAVPVADADAVADAGVDAGAVGDPACATNGCLRAVKFIGRFSRAVLATYVDRDVAIENGYDIYIARYATDGRESTATITIPQELTGAPPVAGFHIVGNNHGTIGLDDPCAPSATVLGAGHAGLFGARGFIGVAVDYPGLGTPGLHPYLVSRVEGTSALDALRAARELARGLGVATSGRFAMAGLSQGGHATLAAAALHASYAPDLDVRAFGATAPAAVWEAHWSPGVWVSGPHISMHAMLIYAWSKFYSWPTSATLWTPAMAARIDDLMTTLCLWSPTGGATLLNSFPEDPADVFDPAFLAAYRYRVWGVYGFVHDAFETNAVRAFTQSAPIRIYQGTADTTVMQSLTDQLVAALRLGGMVIDYQVVPGGTHLTTAFGVLARKDLRTDESIAWLRARLAAMP
ncbi:MAG: hypothetical protein HYY84_00865 [Deltaproteobacteria bacterium]|nr:hypothetical protein [Deltaproteobacteria bacterium]